MKGRLPDDLQKLREVLPPSGTGSNSEIFAALDGIAQSLKTLERRQEQLLRREAEFDRRLLAFENSRFFRLLRWPGRALLDWRGRLGQLLLRSPLHPVYLQLVRPQAAQERYRRWLQTERVPGLTPLGKQPLISVVMPVHKPRREWLETAVESVLAQNYACWELCVCDDASADPWVAEYFAAKSVADPRIRFAALSEHGGISAASNRAGTLGKGEYVCFLDQDDLLPPHALYCIAEAVQDGWPDLLYTDEDRFENGVRVEPIFKPAHSPDLLRCCMYMAHLLTVRRRKLDEVRWLRSAFDGSQDYDLALRVTDTSAAVRHIPRILYHWRKHAGSTSAAASAKRFTHEAGRKALEESVLAKTPQAAVESGPAPNTYRVRWPIPPGTKASLVICSRKPALLKQCLDAVERATSHARREVVVVRHETGDLAEWKGHRFPGQPVWAPYHGPFNFSRMNNLGAKHATGEVLIFINDDVAPLTPDWLSDLIAQALRPEIGVAGAKLLYPSGAIQHAGIVIGLLHGTGHLHRETFGAEDWNWLPFMRNVSAVTGACMAVRPDVFRDLGGFDEAFPVNYNDVDLCLRARQAGYQVVFEPSAVLRHAECGTRVPGISIKEHEIWGDRWAELIGRPDSYYNPNLSSSSEQALLNSEDAPADLNPR